MSMDSSEVLAKIKEVAADKLDADPADVDGVSRLIGDAGGRISGRVGLTEAFVSAASGDDLRTRLTNVVPAGAQLRTGAVDQGSLAASVALDRSTMADVCRRLEDRGLISRAVAPSDGRRKLLALTDAGAEALAAVRHRVAALEGELLGGQDDDARGRLLDDLTALSASWEALASRSA